MTSYPPLNAKKTVTWRDFVRIHLDVLVATDFFNGEMWSGFGLMTSSFLWVIHFVQRRTHTVVRRAAPPQARAEILRDAVPRSERSWVPMDACGQGTLTMSEAPMWPS